MDGTCVTIDERNLIKRFVPKKDFVYEDIPSYYKTVNIYKFSKDFAKNEYIPFLRAYAQALGLNEYYEQVLRVVTLLDKPSMYALPLNGEKWYEIDDIQDLDIAESMFCPPEIQIERLSSRFGGYWRYPGLKDYCYLVSPYFPGHRLRAELKNSFDVLLESYPSGQRVNALLAAKTFGVGTDQIVVGNGAAELIHAFMESVSGDVGFVYPTFEEYPNRLAPERRIVFTPSADNGFRYSAENLISFFSENPASSLVLVNPDNPSGNFLDQEEVMRLVAWTHKCGMRLLVDESFVDFASGSYTLLDETFLRDNPHVIVIKSISKSYGVPGLRLGVLASGDSDLLSQIKRRVSIWNVNSFGEFFLQICEKYQDEYRQGCAQLQKERKRFVEQLRRIRFLSVFPSEANFLLCKVLPPFSAKTLTVRLWVDNGILIKNCSSKKGFDGNQFIRIAIHGEKDNDDLLKALEKLQ